MQMPENTLDPRLLQVHNLAPFIRSIDPSRGDMFASEIGQAPPLSGSQIRRIQTGMERKYGDATVMVRSEENATVLRVIHKRRPDSGLMDSGGNLLTVVIYRDVNGVYGCYEVPVHVCNHQQFGFDYKRTKIMQSLRAGDHIPKGTILAHSPSLDKNGNYGYGINANVLFATIPETIQDGVVYRQGFVDQCKFRGYATRIMSIGNGTVGLNVHGNDDEYKMFPNIGEIIPRNQVVFATRELDEEYLPTQVSSSALQSILTSDKRTCTTGETNCQVIDIEVIHNRSTKSTLPVGTDTQCKMYWEATKRFYREIQSAYRDIQREYGQGVPPLDDKLHRLVTRAEAILFEPERGPEGSVVFYDDRSEPLNEYTVYITYRYTLHPIDGYKSADDSGGKAVGVSVWADEHMPVNAAGDVVDIIMDPGSIVNRMNPSRFFEQYITASMMQLTREIRSHLKTGGTRQSCIDRLQDAYSIISPPMRELTNKIDMEKHLDEVIKDGIYLWCPTNNPVDYVEVVKELRKKYPAHMSPVRYRSSAGKWEVTQDPMLIGQQYIIFLEKIGDEYSSVASPVLQHLGIPGKLTRGDKFSSPGRPQATRSISETDYRLIQANTDPELAIDMLDIANNPETNRRVIRTLLTHDTPTKIDDILEREKYPRGGNSVTRYLSNMLYVGGIEFVYKKLLEDEV